MGHDAAINVAEAGGQQQVSKLRTEFLPFLSCTWISAGAVLVAGHSCVPLIYSVDEKDNQIRLAVRLDQSQKKEAAGISAMRIFQSLDRNSRTENADTSLASIHQNAIACVCVYRGDKQGGVQMVSTSGLDGQLVIWDLDALTRSMKNLQV